jgi:hypothetical protein
LADRSRIEAFGQNFIVRSCRGVPVCVWVAVGTGVAESEDVNVPMSDVVDWLSSLAFLGVVGAGFIAVALLVDGRLDRRRRDWIGQWAAQHGWTVEKDSAVGWTSRLPGRDPYGVSLVVSGMVNGRRFSVADYSYIRFQPVRSESTSRTGTPRHLIVAVIQLGESYPPVAVQPRRTLSRLRRVWFGDRATATGHAEFDRRFRVVAQDPAARGLVDPALIVEHLAGRVPPWSVAGTELLNYQPGELRDPGQVLVAVGALSRVVELFGR